MAMVMKLPPLPLDPLTIIAVTTAWDEDYVLRVSDFSAYCGRCVREYGPDMESNIARLLRDLGWGAYPRVEREDAGPPEFCVKCGCALGIDPRAT